MRFSLSEMTRRAKNPRRAIILLRPINPPSTLATNLYRSVYMPVVQTWDAALPTILAEYERSLGEMTTDSPVDVEALIGQAEAEAQSVILRVSIALERWAATVERWQRRRWTANVLSATNVSLETMVGASDVRMTLEALIARNTGLVRSVSDETRRRIADATFRGLQRRTSSREIAQEIREAVGIERRRAQRIAADQLVKASSALNEERRRQAGVMAWSWVHSDKRNPRPEHEARDGKLYSDDPADAGREYQGRAVRKPPEDRPGELPYCGCTSRAVLIL